MCIFDVVRVKRLFTLVLISVFSGPFLLTLTIVSVDMGPWVRDPKNEKPLLSLVIKI